MLSRRAALQGGTATVAVIAGAGAVTARVAVEDPAIEAAAEVYWAAEARLKAVPSPHTDEEYRAVWNPTLAAYDALMKIPATSLKGCGIKARIYRHETLDLVDGYMNNFDLDGLLADIECLAGRARS